MEIKATVRISPNGYGFGHDWTLVIEKDGIPRTFWLGQAEKYCRRILGRTSAEIYSDFEIRTKSSEKLEDLAWHLIQSIGDECAPALDDEEIAQYIYDNLQSWELACE